MSDTPRTDACLASQRNLGGGDSPFELCMELERELAAMTSRVAQLSEERIKQAAEFQSWMDKDRAISTLRATLHTTDVRLDRMRAAKNKAVEALSMILVAVKSGHGVHDEWLGNVIAELEGVKQ